MKRAEDIVYNQLTAYMKAKHPNVLYRFDFAAGIKMSKGMAIRHSQLNPHRGWPDFILYEPRRFYNGLVLEIKADGKSPYKRDGSLRADQHLAEQDAMLKRFKEKGYWAYFGVGFEHCISIIEQYLAMH